MRLPAGKRTKTKEIIMPLRFFECCGIVSKIQKNFFNSAMDIKVGPVPEGRLNRLGPVPESDIFTNWIRKEYLQRGRIQQTSPRWNVTWDKARLSGKWDPLGSAQKSKFGHIAKRYMHKPESVLQYEIYKILCGLKISKDHLIPVRRPELINNLPFSVFYCFRRTQSENKRKQKIDKYLDPARELKKPIEHEGDSNINCN